MNKIPKENADISKAVRSKLIKQIVLCTVWVILISAFMITFGYNYFKNAVSEYENAIGTRTTILIWIVSCIIPFYLCKCWRWFTDQSYEGSVISCEQTTYIQGKGPRVTTQIRMYTQNIRVRLNNGRVKKIKISWAYDESVPYYYEGDYIRYYRGTKFPQVISDKPEVPRICVMCGTSNLPNDTRCSICGYSLIDHTK